jgi:menaquinone-specific isochorismate synthase
MIGAAQESVDGRSTSWLDAGLAAARRARDLTFVVLPAPVAPATALVGAWPRETAVAWSAADLTLVGIGSALELRGLGSRRWAEIAAAPIDAGHAIVEGTRAPLSSLDLARPRLLGGGAFVPGAADLAPWTGFGDAWFVLPRWLYASDGAHAWLVLAVNADDALHASRWRDELAIHREALATRPAAKPQPPIAGVTRASADAWRAQITAITDAIAAGRCSKIVAARAIEIAFSGETRPADLLATLDDRHADCVRVLVRPTGGASLVAATPERLVRRDGAEIMCDALAGTGTEGAAALLASAKDRHEHALVVEAITGALADVGDVRAPDQPVVRALRHVLHLHTPIRATLREPRHVLELAARLHPTPAVGGTPTSFAVDWIARNEAARGWYAAPVGWFDLAGNGDLAIALRSGVLAGDRAHLWAGAGIVEGSVPDRELAETESKLRAMLGALGAGA